MRDTPIQKKRKKKSAKSTPKDGANAEEQSLAKSMFSKAKIYDVKKTYYNLATRVPNALEVPEAPSAPLFADTSPLAKDTLTQAHEREATTSLNPPKEKGKVEKKKKAKEKLSTVDALPVGTTVNTQPSVAPPPATPIPPTTLTVPSGDTPAPESAVLLNEPKKTKSKKLKTPAAPEAVSTTSPAQVTLSAEPALVTPLTKKKTTKKRLENTENDAATESPSKADQKAKKRKLNGPDDTGGEEKSTAFKPGMTELTTLEQVQKY